MFSTLKTKIWFIVSAIVLIFSFFTLFYFPNQQKKFFLATNNKETEDLARTIAIGVKNAINNEYYEGVKSALKFAREDPRFKFVCLLHNDQKKPASKYNVSVTVPEEADPDTLKYPLGSIIAKVAKFDTETNSGTVMLVFSNDEINRNIKDIRIISLVVSAIVFLCSLSIGFWMSRNISLPVSALIKAARKVGRGDFTQKVHNNSRDEIGELSNAFNKMVEGLANGEGLKKANLDLASLNKSLNDSIEDLKAAQAQLVQSEKMASLGELTAGIAHEIQNPLNFVNNFSEVNKELIDEMKNELASGNNKEAIAIADDISQNEQKINAHGKRADSIVKNMLLHSRTSSGQKESININHLADEYLRLSYQGLRARDKTFNSTIETHFDQEMGMINIIPQDIGRVLLNLYNNAFYAVSEKGRMQGDNYKPSVSVTTLKMENGMEIRVKDNGNGIPQMVLEKIFQPFFTTKPPGQGTGLGLSLSYDIIKALGGEIKVETKEGEFTEFIICLPA